MLASFDINSVIQILMLIVISSQLFVIHKTFKADHERRKKQSTVEYINVIRTDYRVVTNKLTEKYGSNSINLDQLDDETRSDIKELLSILEHMSVGVNTGVYDFYILQRMSGFYLISRYHQLLPYINESQERTPTVYIEFETLCKRIEDERKRKYKSNEGNIKHSP